MIVNAVIEMPANTYYKYEAKGPTLIIDRVVDRRIPYNYGFITNTHAPDGDPLDIFILSSESLIPLTKVSVQVLYGIKCEDNGVSDDKLVGVIVGDTIPPFNYATIHEYLTTYKKGFKVLSQVSLEGAIRIYQEATK